MNKKRRKSTSKPEKKRTKSGHSKCDTHSGFKINLQEDSRKFLKFQLNCIKCTATVLSVTLNKPVVRQSNKLGNLPNAVSSAGNILSKAALDPDSIYQMFI